ncbi:MULTISPECIES: DUF3048 domain-containing protein [unclassified Isoptericola]|uniref:DUF3048 domain-containing protein n=1 Tax=unclassified Isoptericola TaxID=2623355 RepID=UPI0027131070|nr:MULTISPECIES: DUF3048 domain-containing protein [unclassified Isoptericola]MDO8143248.1 DUF3048 domain-containing protein [Isoptericola sp. 178]MDO8147109.1 DUF3048 domain-containing protein [Isoptericola sp. b515]MDO8150576.1 DUF3048 domain-containing protein [Isoptericola sp. b408]
MARRPTALALVLAMLMLAGCSAEPPEAPAPVTVAPDVSRAKIGPPAPAEPEPSPTPEPPRWPLTGKRTDKVPERPAVAVKIENSPAARPHSGLHRADIVWEQVVEGGITRFVAVYHSSYPDAVGPIRSVRPMDPATVAPMDGILAASGGIPAFLRAVERSGTQLVINDDGDPGFWRSSRRYMPHNVYGDVGTFARQADRRRAEPPPAQFTYARGWKGSTARSDGRRGRVADVRLSRAQRSTWTWNAGDRAYRRSDNGVPSISSGRRVTARNVVLLRMKVTNTSHRDASGAKVPKTELVGSGTGTVLSGGRAVDVEWTKKGRGKPLRLTRPNGDEVLLAPGRTWVELVPRRDGSWSVS